MFSGVVGVDEEKINKAALCDFSNKFGISGVALHQFDVVESEEALFGIRSYFDVNGEDFTRGSGSKVGGTSSSACAEFDDNLWLKLFCHGVKQVVILIRTVEAETSRVLAFRRVLKLVEKFLCSITAIGYEFHGRLLVTFHSLNTIRRTFLYIPRSFAHCRVSAASQL